MFIFCTFYFVSYYLRWFEIILFIFPTFYFVSYYLSGFEIIFRYFSYILLDSYYSSGFEIIFGHFSYILLSFLLFEWVSNNIWSFFLHFTLFLIIWAGLKQGVWNRREKQLTRPALPYDYACFADEYSICLRNIQNRLLYTR